MLRGSLVPANTLGKPAALLPSKIGNSCPGPHVWFAVDAPKETKGKSTRRVLWPGSICEYAEFPNRCGRSIPAKSGLPYAELPVREVDARSNDWFSARKTRGATVSETGPHP